MLLVQPVSGSKSTASLPTVWLGQEKSSTFPVCRTTAWIETSDRLNGGVHRPDAAARAFADGSASRDFLVRQPAGVSAGPHLSPRS